ncbi:hypothetical protein F2Q69_00009616 [Brassica cretica]|uniref:Uncharacterized protein n=1 Tax=Brassica cretica TaxID=69181 RepID=A0A8S9P7C2_BRACR|nr:hypothetical protein F2Q69_00009616 [Brassica cretica]
MCGTLRFVSRCLAVSISSNLLASRGLDLLEDEKPTSLSRRLTATKNHFKPLSRLELSSSKSKKDGRSKRRRFVKQDDYNEALILVDTFAWIKVDEEESTNQRIAFSGAIQLALMLVINRSEVELRKGLRVVELGSFES